METKRPESLLDILIGQTMDDPEINALVQELDSIYEKLLIKIFEKKYNVELKVIDDTRVSIDGEVLDDEGFLNWLIDHSALSESDLDDLLDEKPDGQA